MLSHWHTATFARAHTTTCISHSQKCTRKNTPNKTCALCEATRSMGRADNVIQSNAKVDRNKKDDDLYIVGPVEFQYRTSMDG